MYTNYETSFLLKHTFGLCSFSRDIPGRVWEFLCNIFKVWVPFWSHQNSELKELVIPKMSVSVTNLHSLAVMDPLKLINLEHVHQLHHG